VFSPVIDWPPIIGMPIARDTGIDFGHCIPLHRSSGLENGCMETSNFLGFGIKKNLERD